MTPRILDLFKRRIAPETKSEESVVEPLALADAAARSGDIPGAFRMYSQLISQFPQDAVAYYKRGNLHRQKWRGGGCAC